MKERKPLCDASSLSSGNQRYNKRPYGIAHISSGSALFPHSSSSKEE